MPGPCSQPKALLENGVVVEGKTALNRAGVKSGEGMTSADYEAVRPKPVRRRRIDHETVRRNGAA